jgi:hypothetical protein
MKKLLGPHLAGSWTSHIDIVRQWQPPLVLLLQPEVDKVKQLREACPNAIIIGRFYHDDSHYANGINSRPKEFAQEIHNEIVNNPVTPLLDYVQTNNEVCQDWQGIQQLNIYSQEWMHLADQSTAYKCAIMAFSVGQPDLPYKPNDPAGFDGRMLYWQQVLPSLNYAQHNGHILLMHAYGYPDMFHPDADWYIYRYERQVQANLRTLGITNLRYAYGEIGIDRLIVKDKGGYKSVPTTDESYVNQNLQWERDQQSQSLLLGGAIFTAGDSGGWESYDIFSTNVAAMIADHYVEHADEYEAAGQGESPPEGNDQVYIPAVSTGTKPQAPALPPIDYDPRLKERGVHIDVTDTHDLAPGTKYWRVAKVQWYDEQEADRLGPDRHIMIDARDSNGQRMIDLPIYVEWPTDGDTIHTEAKPGEPYAVGFGMGPSRNEYSVWVHDGTPSEGVTGIGMGAETPGGFNAGIHTSTGVTFQLATMPATQPQPTPAPVQPQPTPAQPGETARVIVPAGANLRDTPGTTTLEKSTVLKAVPYGDSVEVLGFGPGTERQWTRVRHDGVEGWILSILLDIGKQQPTTPAPSEPVGDNFGRALDFVLKQEGGWADDPNDPGGATMKGITLGTYTRWRDAHGEPPPTKEDLRNITDAEVRQIYHDWYWLASGSNKLPFPLSLANFNIAVNAGPSRAAEFLYQSEGDFLKYMATALEWYTKIDGWKHYSGAWTRRNAAVLREASK